MSLSAALHKLCLDSSVQLQRMMVPKTRFFSLIRVKMDAYTTCLWANSSENSQEHSLTAAFSFLHPALNGGPTWATDTLNTFRASWLCWWPPLPDFLLPGFVRTTSFTQIQNFHLPWFRNLFLSIDFYFSITFTTARAHLDCTVTTHIQKISMSLTDTVGITWLDFSSNRPVTKGG